MEFDQIANIDPSHHFGVTTTAVSSVACSTITTGSERDQFRSVIKSETAAAAAYQCENNTTTLIAHLETVSLMTEFAFGSKKIHRSTKKKRLLPAKFAASKPKSQCKACEMFGHWAFEHAPDESCFPLSGPLKALQK